MNPSRLARLLPYLLGLLTGMVVGLALLVVLVATGRVPDAGGARPSLGFPHLGARAAPSADESLSVSRHNAIVAAVEKTRRAVVTLSAKGAPFVGSFGNSNWTPFTPR